MTDAIALGDFLRRRRSALDHATIGMPSHGRRRVPGLRREELALLAGISMSYYTRIEQGSVSGVSPSVLDSLARALRLAPDDRAHLFRLARVLPPSTPRAGRYVHPRVELFVRSLDWVPTGVLGRDMSLLAWNRACHRVFADHLPFEAPWTDASLNWAQLLFTDQRVAGRFPDRDSVALDIAGRLRTSQARHPEDPQLTAFIDALRTQSTDFARLWREHPVRNRPLGGVVVRHATLGELELEDVVLRPTGDDDQLVIAFLADPGSATERVLRDVGAAPV